MPAHMLGQKCPSLIGKDLSSELAEAVKLYAPAYNKDTTAIYAGELAKTLAQSKNAVRSDHPLASFVAIGRKAEWLMNSHALDSMFGFQSPLQKLYAQGAKVLLLGSDYESMTALHLVEYLAGIREKTTHEAIIMKNGERHLVAFEDLALDSGNFKEIVNLYDELKGMTKTTIGNLKCAALDYQDLIDFGVEKIG
jgi:aminoglycoside 3-N-acetyltransferase